MNSTALLFYSNTFLDTELYGSTALQSHIST